MSKAAAVAVVGGASLLGVGALLVALSSARSSRRSVLFFLDDAEALARMLASENPNRSEALWIEQIYTQIRNAGSRSLADTLTGGTGSYGPQGGARPVATSEPATKKTREFVARFLAAPPPSQFVGAKRFFEPEQSDRAFAIAEAARRKKAQGLPLTAQELRLLPYKSDATGIRQRWAKSGRYVGTLDGVEFWT
jgi:hypothetical protein